MAFTVNSNTLAFSVSNSYNRINKMLEDISEQIATGKKINSAADNPAGLAQVNLLRSQYSSYGVVRNNLTFGTSLLEASSSALTNVTESLEEMRDLAVQASNGALSTSDRAALQASFAEFQGQIDTTVGSATLFGQNLVSAAAADVDIQSGINAGDTTTVSSVASDSATLGVDTGSINVTDTTNASAAITAIDTAISTIGTNQSTLGAQLNRFGIIDNNIATFMENMDGARSRIEDADIPELTTRLANLQTQQQLAGAMLGLANQLPQQFLSLLR